MAEAQPTVLLVEDNDLLRNLLSFALVEHGLPVTAVGTAEQGLIEFESNSSILLAIVDIVLPGKSGLDLAVELERRRPGLRILYISGLIDSIAMESIARRAPELVLLKPFTQQEFIQRVSALLKASGPRPVPDCHVTAIALSAFPWERLIEASDVVGAQAATLLSYRDTAAGFAMAVTHIAVLRAAGISYTFQFSGSAALPVALLVLSEEREHALSAIERIGLGADVALAA